MARLTLGQKSERVLRFLRGLSEPRVAAALMPFGFSPGFWDHRRTRRRKERRRRLERQTVPVCRDQAGNWSADSSRTAKPGWGNRPLDEEGGAVFAGALEAK